MISSNDFRNGVTIELDGNVYSVIEFQHVKPGKGSAFVRTKLKNAKTGAVVERTFNAGEKVLRAHIDRKDMQYLYANGDEYSFMDNETFEQVSLTRQDLGDALNFLKENMVIGLMQFQGATIGVDLPNSVVLEVVETDPGLKGDTATGGTKAAKLETGYVVRVPLFIQNGDHLIVDTRTGEYLSRA
ncbi:MAG: elongation factor P [Thermaerobacter sp.]|nr:elongation factor P [Thermaerobacter sp.]